MAAKTNTNKTVTDAQLALETKKLASDFEKEKKVKVSIPKTLEKQLGTTYFVGVNGSSVVVPVDGKEYEIPETFAKHLKETIANLK